MINYIEYLNVPTKVAIVLIIVFFIIQAIGEILEFHGKVVPEFAKVRKYLSRKKAEREVLVHMPEMLNKVETLLKDVNDHYSADNITKRNQWINSVDRKLDLMEEKLDKHGADVLSLLIDSKRNEIINFASHVIDDNYSATREQFNRIFKLYEEYEDIIKENGRTNGEVDIAFRIITESYENHMRNHTFVEDMRGYDI